LYNQWDRLSYEFPLVRYTGKSKLLLSKTVNLMESMSQEQVTEIMHSGAYVSRLSGEHSCVQSPHTSVLNYT